MDVKPKKVSKNVLSFTDEYWEWFMHKDKPKYKITGKYLFFCEDRKVLKHGITSDNLYACAHVNALKEFFGGLD